jgi:hypothetical protein
LFNLTWWQATKRPRARSGEAAENAIEVLLALIADVESHSVDLLASPDTIQSVEEANGPLILADRYAIFPSETASYLRLRRVNLSSERHEALVLLVMCSEQQCHLVGRLQRVNAIELIEIRVHPSAECGDGIERLRFPEELEQQARHEPALRHARGSVQPRVDGIPGLRPNCSSNH